MFICRSNKLPKDQNSQPKIALNSWSLQQRWLWWCNWRSLESCQSGSTSLIFSLTWLPRWFRFFGSWARYLFFLAGFKLGQIWQMYKDLKLEVEQMPAEPLTSATGAKLHLKGCIFGGSGSTAYAMCKRCSKSYALEWVELQAKSDQEISQPDAAGQSVWKGQEIADSQL